MGLRLQRFCFLFRRSDTSLLSLFFFSVLFTCRGRWRGFPYVRSVWSFHKLYHRVQGFFLQGAHYSSSARGVPVIKPKQKSRNECFQLFTWIRRDPDFFNVLVVLPFHKWSRWNQRFFSGGVKLRYTVLGAFHLVIPIFSRQSSFFVYFSFSAVVQV